VAFGLKIFPIACTCCPYAATAVKLQMMANREVKLIEWEGSVFKRAEIAPIPVEAPVMTASSFDSRSKLLLLLVSAFVELLLLLFRQHFARTADAISK
jgi:hypothetical protein